MSMRRTLTFIATAVLAATLWGCSYMSVSHLQQQPWGPDSSGEVALRFWRFDYDVHAVDDGYEVTGRAYPREDMPPWANHVEDLWLATYLANAKGKVLASQDTTLDAQQITPEGIPFSFVLDGVGESRKPRFITFGYRMAVRQDEDGSATPVSTKEPSAVQEGPGGVFFASESALTRF